MALVPKERKVMLNHIPSSQKCQLIKAGSLPGELFRSRDFLLQCFAFLSLMSNQELLGSWLGHTDYNLYNAGVNSDVKAFASHP